MKATTLSLQKAFELQKELLYLESRPFKWGGATFHWFNVLVVPYQSVDHFLNFFEECLMRLPVLTNRDMLAYYPSETKYIVMGYYSTSQGWDGTRFKGEISEILESAKIDFDFSKYYGQE